MKNKGPTLRINKFLADNGLCSRREAEELIRKGWVSINGEKVSELGTKVQTGDICKVDPLAQDWLGQKQSIVLNKPPGYVSGQAEEQHKPAIRLITAKNYFGPKKGEQKVSYKGFAPAGRLDIDSTGLLILTQDGQLAKKIISPSSSIEKEYVVKVSGDITREKIKKLSFGLRLDGKALKKAKVKRINETQLNIILTEGKKRQIRRMCEQVDLEVVTLKRIRIGSIELGKLPRGRWRFLRKNEKI